ncbi:MAG: hypothetical protein AB9842_11695 [Bacteroidales bacterium]
MRNNWFLLCFVAILFLFGEVSAQIAVKSTAPVDTSKNKAAIHLLTQLLQKDYTNPLFQKISLFANPDCAHCLDVEKVLQEKNLDFDKYDLRDNNLLMKVHDLIVAKEKTQKVAYGFPIVLYKGELFYNIKDTRDFVEGLLQKMKQ